MKARVMQGFFNGVISDAMLDLVVEQTQKSGDLRVGIDLLKRAALNAERAARRSIDREDICGAYEVSKYLHLEYTIKTLKDEERKILSGTCHGECLGSRDERRRCIQNDKGTGAGRLHPVLRDC